MSKVLISARFRKPVFLIGLLLICLSFQGCASDSLLGQFIKMFSDRSARSLGPDPNLRNQGFADDAGVAGEAAADAQDQIVGEYNSEDPISELESERADAGNEELAFGN